MLDGPECCSINAADRSELKPFQDDFATSGFVVENLGSGGMTLKIGGLDSGACTTGAAAAEKLVSAALVSASDVLEFPFFGDTC